jgi:23S rRNA pseudouridine1911/1915/1917 synthase
MPDPITRPVSPDDGDVRLDVFLARQAEVGSRRTGKEMVHEGLVEVDGLVATRPGAVVQPGQSVRFQVVDRPPPDPLADPGTPVPELPVLYADAYLLAVDKPAGLPSHPPEDRNWRGHSVASVVRHMFGGLPALAGADRPGIVHRLDRDTSGVMVLARTEEAFHSLRAQFKARTTQKEYRCIAFGQSRFDSDWIEQPLGTDPRSPDRVAAVPTGRDAATFYEVVERFAGFTHFRCLPKTGRTHQIRVHMALIGHGLVGDRLYRSRRGAQEALPAGAPDPGRHCLHARRLQVVHPFTQEELELTAPMARDMEALLHWLRQHRSLA